MEKKHVVVLDMNVFVSALLSPNGVPGLILLKFRGGEFQIATSKEQINEIQDVLARPSLIRALPKGTNRDVIKFFLKFKELADVYHPPRLTWDFGDRDDHFLLDLAVWIESAAPNGAWSPNSGKWLLFITIDRIDSAWKLIDSETRSGRLGTSAKVATAKPNSLAANSRLRLICIYTYDCTNIDDVLRVRSRSRELGFVKKIPYKTDSATREGKYAKHGDKKIALFFE